nr:heat shock protein [Biomphalaria glabrata]
MSMPFTQAYFTQEMSVTQRHGQFSQEMSIRHVESNILHQVTNSQQMSLSVQAHFSPPISGPLFHRSLPYLQGNVAQQKPFHPIQKNIAHQLPVSNGQPHKSKQKCFASEQKTTPSVKRRKSSKQKTVLPSNHEDVSKHSVQTNIAHQLSVPHVQPHYSQQSSFASEQKKILSLKRRQSSKQITVERSNHKDVSPQTVKPSKHKDVSPQTFEPSKHKDFSPHQTVCDIVDIVSKNILQESFNQKEFSIKAQEAQQEQKEANISQMISEPLEDSDLNEESLLLDPSLLGFGSEDFSLDIPAELETWCQNMLHDFLNDQKESFHQQNKCDQIEDPHNSLCIPQTAECQLVKGPMNGDLRVSQSDSQQTDVPEFDQNSTLFDPDVPNSNGNKYDNDSAYSSTSPSINSNEDIDWQELYDKIISLNLKKKFLKFFLKRNVSTSIFQINIAKVNF